MAHSHSHSHGGGLKNTPLRVLTLFLSPYTEHARTAFYDDAANRSAAREAVFPSLNPDDYSVD